MKKEKFIESLEQVKIVNLVGPIHDCIKTDKMQKAPILFVDGGIDFFNHLPKELLDVPTLSIGDGDSSSPESQIDLLYPSDKDQTDLQLALDLIPAALEIHAWGLSKGRVDHYLANIGELQRTSKKNKSLVQLDDEILFLPPGKFSIEFEGHFSLLSTIETGVEIEGEILYPLSTPFSLLPLSGRTISNKAHGQFSISSTNGVMVIPIQKSCSNLKLR